MSLQQKILIPFCNCLKLVNVLIEKVHVLSDLAIIATHVLNYLQKTIWNFFPYHMEISEFEIID